MALFGDLAEAGDGAAQLQLWSPVLSVMTAWRQAAIF